MKDNQKDRDFVREKEGEERRHSLRQRWRSWSKKRKMIMTSAAFLVLFGLFSCFGKKGNDHGMVVSTFVLEKKPIQEKLTVSGPVSGTDSVDVVSNLHAQIIAMHVKEGDKVRKDQVLAVLDKTDLEREVEIARNAYELAVVQKEEKDKSEALGYEKAVQDLQKAQADHSRNSQLFAVGGITAAQMEESTNALKDARRQAEGFTVVDGRGAADASYEIQVENAAYDLQKKEEELEDTQIRSAIDGTVVRVNSKVGQFADKVEDDKPILSIENLEQLELEIKVSEYSIGKLQVGQKAVITADILGPDTEVGEITKISPTGEEKGGGSTERVIPTIIRIDGEDTKLIAGITAKAEILIRESDSAFVVPVAALAEGPEGTCIVVVEQGTARFIPVTTGVDGDVNIEVIPAEGQTLAEGMEVIAAPGGITDGMPVTVLPGK